MSTYRHNTIEHCVERILSTDFKDLVKPSSTHQIFLLSALNDPANEPSPLSGSLIGAKYYTQQSSVQTVSDAEISTGNYQNIGKQGTSPLLHSGYFYRYPQEENATYNNQHVLDMAFDGSYGYILWSATDTGSGDDHVYLSQTTVRGEVVAIASVATQSTAPYFSRLGADFSQSSTKRVKMVIDPSVGGKIYIALAADENNVPAFSGGTGEGVMVLLYDKLTLLPDGVQPVVELAAPTSVVFRDLGIAIHGTDVRAWAIRVNADTTQNIMVGGFAIATPGTPTVLSSIKSCVAGDALAHAQWVAHTGGDRLFFGYFNSGTNTCTISTITWAGASEVVFASQGTSLIYTYPPLFHVLGTQAESFFTLLFASDDGTGLKSLWKVLADDEALSYGMTAHAVHLSQDIDLYDVHGTLESDLAGSVYVLFACLRASSGNGVTYIRLNDIDPSTPMGMASLDVRPAAHLGSQVAESVHLVKNPLTDKIWAAFRINSGSIQEVLLVAPSHPTLLVRVKGHTSAWMNSANYLRFVATGGCRNLYDSLLQGTQGFSIYCYDGVDWSRGRKNGYQSNGLGATYKQDVAAWIQIHGSLVSAPPESIDFLIEGHCSRSIDNPSILSIDYAMLYPDEETETVLTTVSSTAADIPHSLIATAQIEQYETETAKAICTYSRFNQTQRWYGTTAASSVLDTLVSLDNGWDALSSTPITGVNAFHEGIHALCVSQDEGGVFALTNHAYEEKSHLLWIDLLNAVVFYVARLDDLYEDLTMSDDGLLYGITSSSATTPHVCRLLNPTTGAILSSVALSSGTLHRIAYDWENDLFYHMYLDGTVKLELFDFTPSVSPIVLSGITGNPRGLIYGGAGVLLMFSTDGQKIYAIDNLGAGTLQVTPAAPVFTPLLISTNKPAKVISGNGLNETQSLAQLFSSPYPESMTLKEIDLDLEKIGAPSDSYRVEILGTATIYDGPVEPIWGDRIAEGVIDLGDVSVSPGGITTVQLTSHRTMKPGETAAVVVMREQRTPTYYGIYKENLSSPYALGVFSERGSFSERDVTLVAALSETLTNVVGLAIHPTTGVFYVTAKVLEHADWFLATVSVDGVVTRIGFFSGPSYRFSCICFDSLGDLYGITDTVSATSPDSLCLIVYAPGSVSVSTMTAVTASSSHALAFRKGTLFFYHLTAAAAILETIDIGGYAVSPPITQTNVPSVSAVSCMVWRDKAQWFDVCQYNEVFSLNPSGTWENTWSVGNATHGTFVGVAALNDGIDPVTSDFSNALAWHRSDTETQPFSPGWSALAEVDREWERLFLGFAMEVRGSIEALYTLEGTRDNGVTWEEMDTTVFSKTNLESWNGLQRSTESIGGRITLDQSGESNLCRMRVKLRGARQRLQALSLFWR